MQFTRTTAIVLGIFTAWPILYIVLFFAAILTMVAGISVQNDPQAGPPSIVFVIVPLHLLTMLDIIALLTIYIIFLFQTDRIAPDKKVLWAVVLFMGNLIAMPIFWYLYIWKSLDQETLPGKKA